MVRLIEDIFQFSFFYDKLAQTVTPKRKNDYSIVIILLTITICDVGDK
jgi:hypothetical protein